MNTIKRKILAVTDYTDYDTQKVLKLKFNESLAREMCLALMLLHYDLTHSLELKFDGFIVTLQMGTKKQSYCLDLNDKQRRAGLQLAPNALTLMLRFLLKYYRDGIGEAEHIDVDFQISNETEFTLTIALDRFKEYSAEEMERLFTD